MAPATLTAFRAGLRWRVMAAMLISLAAGLASAGPQADAGAAQAGSTAAPARRALPVTAYVVNGSDTVTPITTRTNTAGPPITVGSNPYAIAITPDGKTAYVLNSGSDTVTPIMTRSNTARPPIRVGSFPSAIAITPDGKTAYVTNAGSGTVTPIVTRTNTAGPPITVGFAENIAISRTARPLTSPTRVRTR
jgi:YVTN family beta-propeller protein